MDPHYYRSPSSIDAFSIFKLFLFKLTRFYIVNDKKQSLASKYMKFHGKIILPSVVLIEICLFTQTMVLINKIISLI